MGISWPTTNTELDVMQSEVTLTVIDERGRERRVQVGSRRFTIGRIPDNDLMIEDSSLSRRHAVIESFDGAWQISDCGSQNGTFVNGVPVAGAVELHDGDVITLGAANDITVNVRPYGTDSRAVDSQMPLHSAPSAVFSSQPAAAYVQDNASSTTASATGTTPPWLNPHVIAPVAAVLILLVAGFLVAISKRSGAQSEDEGRERNAAMKQRSNTERSNGNAAVDNLNTQRRPSIEPGPGSLPGVDPSPGSTPDAGADELDLIEKYALAVMRSIAKNDPDPSLKRKAVSAVNERVKRYQGSSALHDALRAAKRGAALLAVTAKANGVKPSLVVFATLARMDQDGERGDVVQSGQRMASILEKMRVIFGDELANDNLLAVAALDDGGVELRNRFLALSRKHPESPAMIRDVWYLHEQQTLSDRAYDLVLRFLAIGVIAQDPHKYGVDAEPLTLDK